MSTQQPPGGLPLYRLLLLVAGSSLRSRRATENLQRICDEHLKGRFDLQIIDICEQPELAQKYQVVAIPTLLKLLPSPVRRIIGDLSEKERLMDALELSAPP
jgi:circadian clock protein KaiB